MHAEPPKAPRSFEGRRLSVVAPMHDEVEVLPAFFARLEAVLDGLGHDYEIVCVNDGSRDATLACLLAHRRRNPRIKVIDFSRNFGKEAALTAGLEAATGDVVVPIDADLQDPPELIGDFIAKWEEGYDVAFGLRVDRSSDSRLKRVTASVFYRLFNRVSDVPIPPDAGDFRLMDRAVVDTLKELPERNRFMKGLFAWAGFSQAAVPYVRPERAGGRTSWRYWSLWNFALDGVTSFSTAPIRVWSYVGGVVAALAFLYAGFLIVRTMIVGVQVPGYASLMTLMLFSLGLQMLAMGALGEYVGRIYQEVKKRPLYVVAGRYGLGDAAAELREFAAELRGAA